MSASHLVEAALLSSAVASFRALSWPRSLAVGATLGDLIRRAGLRRRVAEENLASAFPNLAEHERGRVLAANYRELGRVAAEFARLPELGRSALGEVVAEAHGLEHLKALEASKRGALLVTGHFGNFELFAAYMTRVGAIHVVARTLKNPRADAFVRRQREASGLHVIRAEGATRRILETLRSNEWVAVLGDQDAGRNGLFVPFLGRLASTMIGPARLAIAADVPMIMGFMRRCEDGRHVIEFLKPLEIPDRSAPDAAEQLTALHVETLEHWVRRHPESWFWLHRRWKSRPRSEGAGSGARAHGVDERGSGHGMSVRGVGSDLRRHPDREE